ncbi:RidA family protein [Rickettsiales bacterium]|nr:RidA family protein [Rickettsiales bacterium]
MKLGYSDGYQLNSLANYKPYIITNGLIFISGQIPLLGKKIAFSGKIESELSIKDSRKAISLSTFNLLNVLCKITEDNKFDEANIKAINIKGYLNTEPSFVEHSKLFDEASDILIQVLGENNGNHSRSVIGVNSLPLNSPVEIDGIFSILNHNEERN